MLTIIKYAWEGFDMADASVFTCPECGKEIKERGKFCPHCAAPLPLPEPDSDIGYWNFYGAISDPEPEANPGLGARGVFRLLSVVAFFAFFIAGFAASGFAWGFRWYKAWPFWAIGVGVAAVLFLISFLMKPKEK